MAAMKDVDESSFEVTLDDFAGTLDVGGGGGPRAASRLASSSSCRRLLEAGVRRLSARSTETNGGARKEAGAMAADGGHMTPWQDVLFRALMNGGESRTNPIVDRDDRGVIWDALHCSPASNSYVRDVSLADAADDERDDDDSYCTEKEVREKEPTDQSPVSAIVAKFRTLVEQSTDAGGTPLDVADTLCLSETVSISESEEEEEAEEEDEQESLSSTEKESAGRSAPPAATSFAILGASPSDDGATYSGRVLTPALMDALHRHVPYAVQGDSFWLRYSLVRDGASLQTLLSKIRFSSHTFIAIETVHGEVFGSFTSSPWRRNGSAFFGSCESFLWRLARPRRGSEEPCESSPLKCWAIRPEGEVDIFAWSGCNRNIQLLSDKMLAVGGGEPDDAVRRRVAKKTKNEVIDRELASDGQWHATGSSEEDNRCWDFGLTLAPDLLSGTTDTCATFDDNSEGGRLSRLGRTFEALNVEVWSLTPTVDTAQANDLERRHQFAAPLLAGPLRLEMNDQLPKAA